MARAPEALEPDPPGKKLGKAKDRSHSSTAQITALREITRILQAEYLSDAVSISGVSSIENRDYHCGLAYMHRRYVFVPLHLAPALLNHSSSQILQRNTN